MACSSPACRRRAPVPCQPFVYIGTYTGAKSKGIYSARFDTTTGRLSAIELAAETKNPTFLAVHPKLPVLYAVAEVDSLAGQKTGGVKAFRINGADGKLTLLNPQSSGGKGPCHVAVDGSGKCALVANYGSGSIAALPIKADGSLGAAVSVIQHQGSSVNPQRQAGPHAHFIATDPDNRLALACDLGLDKVLLYRLDPVKSVLTPNEPAFASLKPGSGPRHFGFRPDHRFVYVVNEMGSSVTTFAWDKKQGGMREVQMVSTIPEDFKGDTTCAELQVHPSGKFVYASNRGHDSIAVFASDRKSGRLSLVEHRPTDGKTPRHFAIDPSGNWLLAENQGSDSIVVFKLDPKTGKLAPTNQRAEVGSPVCLVFAK